MAVPQSIWRSASTHKLLNGKKNHLLPAHCLILNFYGCPSLHGNLGLNVDPVSFLCFFVPLNQSTHEAGPSSSWSQGVHFDWMIYNTPLHSGCFCLVLRRHLSPVSENWNGSLPPWEWDFAFLADILSRPRGVGCHSISQNARCNYTKILQSLFVERVRVLALASIPLRRKAWDRVVNKSTGLLEGLWVSPWRSCQPGQFLSVPG